MHARIMPSISYIVARSYPGNVIGRENQLPWRLRSDLRRFREITSGHAVIMGRKTFESIGRPLPNRLNIVLSKSNIPNSSSLFPGGVSWVNSVNDAVHAADHFSILNEKKNFFVIGGDVIYKLLGRQVNTVYLTEVMSAQISGDAWFDMEFDRRQWRTTFEEDFPRTAEDQYPSRFSILERKDRYVRILDIRDFYTDKAITDEWIEKFAKLPEPSQELVRLHREKPRDLLELA
jgi:dihydrofolate reductase